ncbi:MAG: hypothetical protein O2816_14195 [Planctomycetota bacterium]|nr:hypothetical protein [Planctomycetota bacterium]
MRVHHTLFCAAALSAPAAAQMTFTIDWHGPTIGMPDSFGGVPITEGDLLMAPGGVPAIGPLPVPGIGMPHGAGGLGLLPGCIGHPGGTPCHVEVDAISIGKTGTLADFGIDPGSLWFSVDEYAGGMPMPPAPNVFSEAPFGDSSGDAFINLGPLPVGPLAPGAPVGHVGAVDGDGLASGSGFAYPGIGIVEPDLPFTGPAHTGDGLDGFDLEAGLAFGAPVWFSLDSFFPDPLTGIPNTGSAFAHGASGADVLVSPAPGIFGGVWAPAFALGLDFVGPDDIDALVVGENGTGVFEPSLVPYDWFGGGTDMLLFSVRRGSAVIGMPDSIFGIPIEEGDILTTPLPTFLGGVSPFPGLFIAAEKLGLGTVRSGTAMLPHGDDLDALDIALQPYFDCNGNGVEDAVDIGAGTSLDANKNGIPDECETVGVQFCFCAAGAPCGNIDPSAGCSNSTGVGGLLTGSGGSSIGLDDLVLTATGLPPSAFNLLFMGPSSIAPAPFADGLRCVGGTLYRYPIAMADGSGTSVHTGLVTYANSTFPPAGNILIGSTWHFQDWYRDPGGPCGFKSNATNAVAVMFTP